MHVFALNAEFFKEFLARAYPRESDLDVFTRTKTAEGNQFLGQVHDLDGLTHIQHKDLSPLAHGSGLQDQLTGFGNGHKVTLHVRMGYGHRSAFDDLFLEDRYHGSVRSQDIAKPHGDEVTLTGPAEVLDVEFRHALARAHDTGGIDGLVRADHDEV